MNLLVGGAIIIKETFGYFGDIEIGVLLLFWLLKDICVLLLLRYLVIIKYLREKDF